MESCLLCNAPADEFFRDKKRVFFQCRNCRSVFVPPSQFPEPEEEKNRYLEHNNDIYDERYRRFVLPLAQEITDRQQRTDTGLDYGSGPGPVVTQMLREKQYRVITYDPYFKKNPEIFKSLYDYIFCSEVIEHFHDPKSEFEGLKTLLNPGGVLYCMTDMFTKEKEFASWGYKNDPTHVFFYHQKAFHWISEHFDFRDLIIRDRLILLFNK